MGGMPRFSIKFLLVVFAIAALWLSTFAGYGSASDVRAFIMLSILAASGVAAISYDGRRRAFWIGFFITILEVGVNGRPHFGFYWVTTLLNAYGQYQNLPNGFTNYGYAFYDATLRALVVLLIATLMGFIGILIYGHCQRIKN
jgi:hypothetical protein